VNAQFACIPGGKYRARQNSDGTWDILDMPVFSIVPEGKKSAPKDIGEIELREAVTEHQRKYREDGFLARTILLHNYGSRPATPAGFFLPRDVRPFRMAGELKPVIFADILNCPDDVFQQIDGKVFPYCSVEVRSYEPLVFGALALLDTEPPFFEFPIITIGDKQMSAVTGIAIENDSMALARFQFAEAPMPDKDMEEKKKDDTEDAQMADEGMDVKAIVKAIESGEISVADMEAIVAAISAREGAGEEDTMEESDVVDEPVAAMSHADPERTTMTARIAALEDRLFAAERKQATDKMFSAEIASLERDGFNVSDDTRDLFREAAERGEDNLKLFSAVYRKNAIQDPPEDFVGFPSSGGQLPEEVAAYSHKSPELFAAAKTAYREWSEMPDDRYRSPLARFLQREVG